MISFPEWLTPRPVRMHNHKTKQVTITFHDVAECPPEFGAQYLLLVPDANRPGSLTLTDGYLNDEGDWTTGDWELDKDLVIYWAKNPSISWD